MTNETLNIGEVYTLFVMDKELGQKKYPERQCISFKSPLIEYKSVYLGKDLRTDKHGFVSRAKQGSLELVLYALDDEAATVFEGGKITVPESNQGKVFSETSCQYREWADMLNAKGL